MTDSLRSVSQRAQVARGGSEDDAPAPAQGWWASMPAEQRTGLLAVLFLVLGVTTLALGVGFLVGLTVSIGAGAASGSIVVGLALFTIGVLFGLSNS